MDDVAGVVVDDDDVGGGVDVVVVVVAAVVVVVVGVVVSTSIDLTGTFFFLGFAAGAGIMRAAASRARCAANKHDTIPRYDHASQLMGTCDPCLSCGHRKISCWLRSS